jgi:hypothetical protein
VWRGILPGGLGQTADFLRTMPLFAPTRIPLVVSEWIVSLSMQEFARRHLASPPAASTIESRVASLHAAIAAYLAQGGITLSLRQPELPDLAISLHGLLDKRFFKRVAPHLRDLLENTRAQLTFRIDGLDVRDLRQFERLLGRLTRYGDRVFIEMDKSLGSLLPIDSSVFNLVLDRNRVCS